jgi:hypothetical protein
MFGKSRVDQRRSSLLPVTFGEKSRDLRLFSRSVGKDAIGLGHPACFMARIYAAAFAPSVRYRTNQPRWQGKKNPREIRVLP